ncbi:hypothetical protein VQ643_08010 [Pseudomonas sp. F1_0610]|uniref:hypothetical protein n=1 Tax=Pseudomonas sp. F1_0610 TaxID=3114284 RepID=UPI0039C32463
MNLVPSSKFTIGLLTLSLLSGCGEIIIGTGCILGSASDALSPSKKLNLPNAQEGTSYQQKIMIQTDSGFGIEEVANNLPAGLTAELLGQDKNGNWSAYTPAYITPSRELNVWLQVSGTPEKHGRYAIKLSNTSRPSMCGSSVSYYKVQLNVEKAEPVK